MSAAGRMHPPLPVVLDEVTTALESLSEALSRDDDLPVLLGQVCEQVVRAVPGIDDATVTLLDACGPYTAASTSDLVTRLDQVQYRTAAGPCLTAAETRKLVRTTIDEAETRWPAFGAASRSAGIGSVLSAPLAVDSRHIGAVNGYATNGHGFLELDAPLLALYTRAVETALRSHSMYLHAFKLAGQLREALESRAVIDQAKGALMAANGITADQAFQLLVERSQHQNVKLRDLAERFVADVIGGTRPAEGRHSPR